MENHAFVADHFDNLKTLKRKERTLLVSICIPGYGRLSQ
jgi:hypothetical protein